MNQLTEHLYIGDIREACEKHIPTDVTVTVCQDSIEDNVSGNYYHFNMSDGPDNRYGGDHSYELFEIAVDTVLKHVLSGESVFVHCHMGQSRSAAVCMAVIGTLQGLDVHEAYGYIKDRRPQIHPDGMLYDYAAMYIRNA